MAFTVEFVAVPSREFGDKDKLEFLEGGVLKITRQDKTNLYFSPANGRPSVTPPPWSGPQIHPWPDNADLAPEDGPF